MLARLSFFLCGDGAGRRFVRCVILTATGPRAHSNATHSMNELHRSLADKILRHIRTSALPEGAHLRESALAEQFGTSRPPVRNALTYLEQNGIVAKVPNKGFFVANADAAINAPEDEGAESEAAIYMRIADDRLARDLPDRVSENELMRRYNVSRMVLRRILTRISTEGWIEPNEGRGWTFAALIDSVEAYRESYALRQVLEVYGLRADEFHMDAALLADLRKQQQIIYEGGWQTLSRMELFEVNATFHETLARMSGNRFVYPAVQKLNQLRRLVEYRQTGQREQVRQQNREHLEILDALEAGDRERAADLMHAHLGQALVSKARSDLF